MNTMVRLSGSKLSGTGTALLGLHLRWVCSVNEKSEANAESGTLSLISGANSHIYEPTSNGDFVLVVEGFGCSDTSQCLSFQPSALDEIGKAPTMSILPNPNSGDFTLIHPNQSGLHFTILDATGRRMHRGVLSIEQETNIHLDLAPGIYFISFKTDHVTPPLSFVVE